MEEADEFNLINSKLKTIWEFVTTSKDNIGRKKDCTDAIQSVQEALGTLQSKLAVNKSNENLKKIVEQAVAEAINSRPIQSYAQAASSTISTTRITVQKNEKKYKAIIYPREDVENSPGSSEETKRALLKLDPRRLGVKPDRVVMVKDKGVLIESSDPNVEKLVESKYLREAKLGAKIPSKQYPRIIVYGTPKEWSELDILNEIDSTIPEGADIPSKWCKSYFKVGPKDSKYNPNWVFEVHPEVRRLVIQKGKIYFDWKSCNVEDYVRVSRCYKCQRFGHVAKHCNSEKQCGFCASTDHESKDCRYKEDTARHKCANCMRAGKKETDHDASAKKCAIYAARIQDYINNIDYGLPDE